MQAHVCVSCCRVVVALVFVVALGLPSCLHHPQLQPARKVPDDRA